MMFPTSLILPPSDTIPSKGDYNVPTDCFWCYSYMYILFLDTFSSIVLWYGNIPYIKCKFTFSVCTNFTIIYRSSGAQQQQSRFPIHLYVLSATHTSVQMLLPYVCACISGTLISMYGMSVEHICSYGVKHITIDIMTTCMLCT